MKTLKLIFILLLAFVCSTCSGDDEGTNDPPAPTPNPELPVLPEIKGKIIVAYVTAWSVNLPDATKMTHINYAFADVNPNRNGLIIQNENRLRSIVALKTQVSTLKVLLAIGGWGSGGFSEMARDEAKRKAFATDCKRAIEQFNLDGVDIDWEYPTSSAAGIVSSPDDTKNYTLMIKDIRAAIGDNKLLTLASSALAGYINFTAILPYVNYINIMGYDYDVPPSHHSALYTSPLSASLTSDKAVNNHLSAGVPATKLVLGVPFYGLGDQTVGLPYSVNYKDIPTLLAAYVEQWDDTAKVPYYSNASGKLVFTYENAQSIQIKCEYALNKNLLGMMYWQYDADDAAGTLRSTVYNVLSPSIVKE